MCVAPLSPMALGDLADQFVAGYQAHGENCMPVGNVYVHVFAYMKIHFTKT